MKLNKLQTKHDKTLYIYIHIYAYITYIYIYIHSHLFSKPHPFDFGLCALLPSIFTSSVRVVSLGFMSGLWRASCKRVWIVTYCNGLFLIHLRKTLTIIQVDPTPSLLFEPTMLKIVSLIVSLLCWKSNYIWQGTRWPMSGKQAWTGKWRGVISGIQN